MNTLRQSEEKFNYQNFCDEVIQLHRIARDLGMQKELYSISLDIRRCADELSFLINSMIHK